MPTLHVYLLDMKGKPAPFLLTFFGISKKQYNDYIIDGINIAYQALEQRGLAGMYQINPARVEQVTYD